MQPGQEGRTGHTAKTSSGHRPVQLSCRWVKPVVDEISFDGQKYNEHRFSIIIDAVIYALKMGVTA